MSPEQTARVRAILRWVQDVPSEERDAFLDATCDDPEVRAEVCRLLAEQQAGATIITGGASADIRTTVRRGVLYPGVVLKERYQLSEQIGKGGFGKVFLATDLQLHSRQVVVKALLEENAADPWFEKRLNEEIRALSAIDHPGVIGVLDSGRTEDGTLFLVMQFAEGVSLKKRIQPEGLPFPQVADLVRQIAYALDAAHQKGVVHHDLKPENVMVQSLAHGGDHVRLIDFGIARLRPDGAGEVTEVSRVVGSPLYMAPEQLLGHGSAASDIYALAVVAFEMLTGKRPFTEHRPVQLHALQKAGGATKPRALRPELPPRAETVLLRALSFNAANRPLTASEFAADLEAALESGPVREIEVDAQAGASTAEYDVFLGHASADRALALHIAMELEQRGIRCFLSSRDVRAGELLSDAVAAAITSSRCFAALITGNANASEQLTREAEAALNAGSPMAVLRVSGVEPDHELALLLENAVSVEMPLKPGAGDFDTLDRVLRQTVRGLGESVFVPPPAPGPATDSPEPMFTEFGDTRLLPHPSTRRMRLIAWFFGWSVLSCLLSVFANTHYMTVTLQAPDGSLLPVRFGYLYELNGAFLFLFVAPFFIYYSFGFVLESQVALVTLARRDQLVVNLFSAEPARDTPLSRAAESHRRWMSRPVLAILFVGMFLIVVGAEFLPPSQDYKRVMFGYVQAPWIADYGKDCPNCTLAELSAKTGRRLEPLSGRTLEETAAYRIVPTYYERSAGWGQRVAFVLFLTSTLSMMSVFGVLQWWVLLNAIFFLRLVYRAVSPGASSLVGLHLRFGDRARMFGLEPIHRALRQYVGAITLSVVMIILGAWSNALKGSRHGFGDELYTLGGMARFLSSEGSFLMAVSLMLYLIAIGGRARDAAAERRQRLTELAGRAQGWKNLDRILVLIAEQSVWRNPRYTIPYLLTPSVCTLAVLLARRAGAADWAGGMWEVILRYVMGRG